MQKGFAHLFILLILGLGILAGIYLLRTGNLKIFSRAGAPVASSPETSFVLTGPENINAGKEFEVQLFARSDLEEANLFTAALIFPKELIEVKEIKIKEAFIKNWIENFYDNNTGKIVLSGGIPAPGVKTEVNKDSALMGVIVFKAKTEGKGNVSFGDSSAIYSNLNNINILTKKEEYNFSLTSAADEEELFEYDRTFEIGLEAGEQHDSSRVPLVSESGAKWVRLNFVGSNWSVGSSDVNKYNSIINDYIKKGLKIIGLIGSQSIEGGYNRNDPEGFGQKFLSASEQIIARFGDRVKVYELFNEPNDWAGGNSSQISERYFAQYLSKIYRKIKIEQKKKDIILISGPLFSFDINTGAGYLQNVYNEGKALAGSDSWNAVKSESGSYPLDGIGYHIYVAQGMNDTIDVESKFKANLSSVELVIAANDSQKQLWITEFGWGTGVARVSEDVQAENMNKAYRILRADPKVKLGMWFTLKDFDGSEWGLVRQDERKKKAWSVFQRISREPQPTEPPQRQSCSAQLSFICDSAGKHKLNASWNLEDKFGFNTCNVYLRDNRGDHQINGSNNAGSCLDSISIDALEGNPIFNGGHYQLFASNGDPEGGCYNQQKGDVILNCGPSTPQGPVGDLNGDLKITLADMSVLLSKWSKKDAESGKADLNEDGMVNAVDYSMMIKTLTESGAIKSR